MPFKMVKKISTFLASLKIIGTQKTDKGETLVKNCYKRDDISRMMPRMKNFRSVKNDDGTRSQIQKRLLLCNSNELYTQFTWDHEDLKINIFKFTKLRPRHCVLAGSSSTYNVCIWVHRENFQLVLDEINIQHLTVDTDMMLKNYHDCLDAIVRPDFQVPVI